jgi:hypothetical protein
MLTPAEIPALEFNKRFRDITAPDRSELKRHFRGTAATVRSELSTSVRGRTQDCQSGGSVTKSGAFKKSSAVTLTLRTVESLVISFRIMINLVSRVSEI